MSLSVSAFKAYDIRGRVPDELNEKIAEAIGRTYASYIVPRRVVVGHDTRLSSPQITDALEVLNLFGDLFDLVGLFSEAG